MKNLLILTPFLLGNSAPVGAIIPFIIGAVVVLGVAIALVWGIVKFFSS